MTLKDHMQLSGIEPMLKIMDSFSSFIFPMNILDTGIKFFLKSHAASNNIFMYFYPTAVKWCPIPYLPLSPSFPALQASVFFWPVSQEKSVFIIFTFNPCLSLPSVKSELSLLKNALEFQLRELCDPINLLLSSRTELFSSSALLTP